jgi:hypothetical protein
LNLEKLPSYRAVPGDRFQTTNEQRSHDDLTCSEVKQRNPIGTEYRCGLGETQTITPFYMSLIDPVRKLIVIRPYCMMSVLAGIKHSAQGNVEIFHEAFLLLPSNF